MTLLENIELEQSYTTTENGACALNTTGSALLDLFSSVGGMRCRTEEVTPLYKKALAEDKLLAVKLAFYTRDIRGGLGERAAARTMFHYLASNYPQIITNNMALMVEVGRWDDLIELLDTPVADEVVKLISNQLSIDVDNMLKGLPISLLAKWLPSINTSSLKTKRKAVKLVKQLNMTQREYRKTLSSLRAYSNVVEVKMSEKMFDAINYDSVPSKALNNYHNAFIKNDGERYTSYLEKVNKGEAKVNASTLFPYDITMHYLYGKSSYDETLEAQFKALPEYVEGDNRFLVMADVSGSMTGRPLATSVGLAIYFAQRNEGAFHNKFMTFSSKPELVTIKGESLFEQIGSVISSNWDMNTDLLAAFELILDTAIKHGSKQEELPTSIIIISDMEIDDCTNGVQTTFYDAMKNRYEKAGYQLPNIIFWNVESRQNTFHASMNQKGVQLCSGQSASVFKTLISGGAITPLDFMANVLNNDRYASVKI